MAGTLFQDNLSPYLTVVEQGSTPATPSSGNQKLFVRTSDHLLCYVNSSGTVTAVSSGGAGSGTVTTVKDEGSNLSTAVVSLDFVGRGVAATGTTAVTVTIPGVTVAVIQDQKTQNTAGGTFTSGSWQTRVLQTEQSDAGSIVTIASNQFTPVAGTYLIRATAPASLVNRHQARLQNVTAVSTTIVGTTCYAGTGSDEAPSTVEGVFTANGTDAYEIQHQCQTTAATNGFGIPSNFTTEVYATVTLIKIA